MANITRWNPSSILDIKIDGWRYHCMGTTVRNRRCKNPISAADGQSIDKMIQKLSGWEPTSGRALGVLELLVDQVLCKARHRGRPDQCDLLLEKWQAALNKCKGREDIAPQSVRRAIQQPTPLSITRSLTRCETQNSSANSSRVLLQPTQRLMTTSRVQPEIGNGSSGSSGVLSQTIRETPTPARQETFLDRHTRVSEQIIPNTQPALPETPRQNGVVIATTNHAAHRRREAAYNPSSSATALEESTVARRNREHTVTSGNSEANHNDVRGSLFAAPSQTSNVENTDSSTDRSRNETSESSAAASSQVSNAVGSRSSTSGLSAAPTRLSNAVEPVPSTSGLFAASTQSNNANDPEPLTSRLSTSRIFVSNTAISPPSTESSRLVSNRAWIVEVQIPRPNNIRRILSLRPPSAHVLRAERRNNDDPSTLYQRPVEVPDPNPAATTGPSGLLDSAPTEPSVRVLNTERENNSSPSIPDQRPVEIPDPSPATTTPYSSTTPLVTHPGPTSTPVEVPEPTPARTSIFSAPLNTRPTINPGLSRTPPLEYDISDEAMNQPSEETPSQIAELARLPLQSSSADRTISGRRRQPLEGDCAICQDDIIDGCTILWCKAECGHNYHYKCLAPWYNSQCRRWRIAARAAAGWEDSIFRPIIERPNCPSW